MITFLAKLLKRDFVSSIAYRHFNERDVEVPALLAFLERRRGRFVSLLDVGAGHSHAYYAPLLRQRFPQLIYDGVDLVADPESAKHLSRYHVGHVIEAPLGPYEVVTCISTIEHCGLSPSRRDNVRDDQLKVFERVASLARKYLFVTFPYGCEGRVEGEYANITPGLLDAFIAIAGGRPVPRFFFNEFPQGRKTWREISGDTAATVPVRVDRGVQCLCVLEIDKPAQPLRAEYHGISEHLLKRATLLRPEPEYTPGADNYAMFNTGGVELETGEFLYSLVKLIKPLRILETGTHLGVSAMYMAQALKENGGGGRIDTLEINKQNLAKSQRLWKQTEISDFVRAHRISSAAFASDETYDLLFLDSEPYLRFDELVRFYPALKPGGYVLIHDLHDHLGLTGLVIDGMNHWPFGDFREKFGSLIKDSSLQTVTFPAPRGLVLFQKASADFAHTTFLRGDP